MDGLLGKIFDSVVSGGDESIELGKRFDEEVLEIIKPLEETMDENEVETIRELIYEAAYYAEKHGFYEGVHTAIRFLAEAENILDETE